MNVITTMILILSSSISFGQVNFKNITDTPDINHDTYHKYEGDYYFNDGTYITGGPMDEVEGSMLFMDPIGLDKGGLFIPNSNTVFSSIIDTNTQIQFDLNQNSEVYGLWWKESGREHVYAKKKQNYTLQTVQFYNGDVILSGELYLPKTEGPHSVVINVHGSGRQTRHGGPWNTFFLKYGIAVLAYDKRGVGKSTGDFSTAGYEDFASDVLAAINFVRNHHSIDSDKVGIHGSSEGGWVSSIAASMSNDLSFMIIRAGSGVSGSDTYMHEVKIELLEKGLTNLEYIQAVRFERKIQDMAADDKSLAEVNTYIKETRENNTWFPKAFGDYREMSPAYWIKSKKSGPIDPVDYLRKISDIPILWFLAEKDENVPYELSIVRLEDALDEAGNKNFELVTIPDAKHSFLVYSPDGNVKYADGYWTKMISWLKKHGFTKSEE